MAGGAGPDAGRVDGADVALLAACGLAALYAGLAVLHALLLTGTHRIVLTGLAGASAAGLAAVAWEVRSRRRADVGVPTGAVDALAVVPLLNSLLHLAVTGELHQTTTLMLTLVGTGAAVTSGRLAAALGSTALLGWATAVALRPALRTDDAVHYGLQLLMAAVLAVLLHRVRARRERRLRAARDELALSERRFRSIFDASPVGVGLADEHGRFLAANAALCRLFARPVADVLGHSSVSFTHPDDRASHGDAATLLSSSPDRVALVEKRYVRPDGDVRWAWLTLAHVDSPNGEPWTLAHVQDVTERHAAEQALRESQGNLAAVAQVVRRIRTGEDARTSIVQALLTIARASSVTLIEPVPGAQSSRTAEGLDLAPDGSRRGRADALLVTASAGADLVGTRIALTTASVMVEVYRSGQAVFLADPGDDPRTDPALLALSGARSMLWQPVLTRGTVTAVLAVTWDERMSSLGDQRSNAVALLADETALALEHEQMLRQLERQAHTDALTGLGNRRAWDTNLPALLDAARRTGRPVTVAIADLDHFKRYNDAHGHPIGDELLRRAAHAFRGVLRDTDLFVRWGGEEFAIALPDCPAHEAAIVLERLRRATPDDQTCSIGHATWDTVEPVEQLLARADAALYDAKAGGRDLIFAG